MLYINMIAGYRPLLVGVAWQARSNEVSGISRPAHPASVNGILSTTRLEAETRADLENACCQREVNRTEV